MCDYRIRLGLDIFKRDLDMVLSFESKLNETRQPCLSTLDQSVGPVYWASVLVLTALDWLSNFILINSLT